MAKEINGRERMEITSVPVKLKGELVNIAKYKGINLSSFVKSSLRDVANSYPEHIRKGKI